MLVISLLEEAHYHFVLTAVRALVLRSLSCVVVTIIAAVTLPGADCGCWL